MKKPQGQRNRAASIRQRLRNHAHDRGEDVALVLTRYVCERFLYRLSVSPHRNRFMLRGAMLFAVWTNEPHRPTRDVDMLASGDNSAENIVSVFRDICGMAVDEDGLSFLTGTLRAEERAEGRAYGGLHVEMEVALDTARPRLEVDIAFGEAVTPAPEEIELPALLEMPPPRLRAYPVETVIAEKCEAMVSLGIANTRLKDFFDLWFLSRTHTFEGATLRRALEATFARRDTAVPDGVPIALTPEFYNDAANARRWNAFINRTSLRESGITLAEVAGALQEFLVQPLAAIRDEITFDGIWHPAGPWEG